MEQEKITYQEAIAQGYEHYVYNNDGYQSLKDISDVESIDFNREDLRLVNKEPYHPSGISSKDIAELLAEHLECNHSGESGDDTEAVYDAIKALDFSEAEAKISEALSGLVYYRATDIKLTP